MCPSPCSCGPFPLIGTQDGGISENMAGRAGEMPVVFDTVVNFTGILNSFLSEHKACSSPRGTLGVGVGEDAVMKLVSQCCLNIVDNSVKFLFMNISV